jgi:hypothetical protein
LASGLIALAITLGSASSQTILVRLVNGRTGKPISNENVTLIWDAKIPQTVVRVDGLGKASVAIPSGTKNVTVMVGPRKGKEPDRIAYFDCNGEYTTLIPIEMVLSTGYVAANRCSIKIAPVSAPGELIYLAQPRRWWKLDMQ